MVKRTCGGARRRRPVRHGPLAALALARPPMVPWTAMKEPLRLPFVFLLVVLCSHGGPRRPSRSSPAGLEDWPRRSPSSWPRRGSRARPVRGDAARGPPLHRAARLPHGAPADFAVPRLPHRARRGLRGARERPDLDAPGRSRGASPPSRRRAAARYLPTKSFTAVGDAPRRAGRPASGDRLGPVLVLDPAAKAPRFTALPLGHPVSCRRTARSACSSRGRSRSRCAPSSRPPRRRCSPPTGTRSCFLRDFRDDERRPRRAAREGARPGSSSRASRLLFLVTALLVLLRATRWPLFNVLLLVLAVRALPAAVPRARGRPRADRGRVDRRSAARAARPLGRVRRPRRARPARRHPVRAP